MSVGESPGRVESAYGNIRLVLEKACATAYRAVNSAMTEAYWDIGRIIVEEEQKGRERAGYGRNLIKQLSERLTRDYGRGYDRDQPEIHEAILPDIPEKSRTE